MQPCRRSNKKQNPAPTLTFWRGGAAKAVGKFLLLIGLLSILLQIQPTPCVTLLLCKFTPWQKKSMLAYRMFTVSVSLWLCSLFIEIFTEYSFCCHSAVVRRKQQAAPDMFLWFMGIIWLSFSCSVACDKCNTQGLVYLSTEIRTATPAPSNNCKIFLPSSLITAFNLVCFIIYSLLICVGENGFGPLCHFSCVHVHACAKLDFFVIDRHES